MAWRFERCDSFDHNVSSTAGAGLYNALVNAAINAGAAQTGGFGMRCSPGAAAAGYAEYVASLTTFRQVYFKGTLKIPTLPASDLVLAMPFWASSGIRTYFMLTSGGNLKITSHDKTVTQNSASTYTAGQVVNVEIRVFVNNSTGVRTVRWRLNSNLETTLTGNEISTSALNFYKLGSDSTAGPAATIDWDDCIWFVSSQTTEEASWPSLVDGTSIVRLHLPNADGSHTIGSGTWSDSTGTGITAGTTNSWTFIDDPAGGTDFIRKTAGTAAIASENLRHEFESVSDVGGGASDTPFGFTCVAAEAESAVQAEICWVDLTIAGSANNITTGDIGSTTVVYKSASYPLLSPSWTVSDVDAMFSRYGSTDPSPEPRLHSVFVQMAYTPAAGTAYTESATVTVAIQPSGTEVQQTPTEEIIVKPPMVPFTRSW